MKSHEQACLNADSPVAETTLPEYWPEEPTTSPPRAAWIPWPIAILLVPLLWFFPKSMRPHFGRVAWPGVIIGHLLWTVYGIGSVALAFYAPQAGLPGYLAQSFKHEPQDVYWPVSLSEAIRSPAALLVEEIADQSARSTEYFLLLIGGTVLATMVTGAAGGLLLMPWTGVDDKRWRLWLHCAKLTLWSTTSLVVLGLGLQTAALVLPEVTSAWWVDPDEMIWVLGPLAVALWMWIWLRSVSRYAPPSDSPRVEPRRPLCEGCGYVLTGLTTSGNCPECGASVACSMPSNRSPSAFAAARNRRERFIAYFTVAWQVVFNANYLKRIQLRNGFEQARQFALWSAVLGGLVASTTYFALQFVLPTRGEVPHFVPIQFLQAFLIAWVGFALLALVVASLLLQGPLFRTGPFHPRAIVGLYSSAWAIPLAAGTALMIQVLFWSVDVLGFPLALKTAKGIAALVSTAAAGGVLVTQVVIVQRRLRHAMRWAGFTNA